MSELSVKWEGDSENEANVAQLRHVLNQSGHILLKIDFGGVVTAAPSDYVHEDAYVFIKPGATVEFFCDGLRIGNPE